MQTRQPGSALFSAALPFLFALAAPAPAAPGESPIELGHRHQLFFDDSAIESRHDLARVVHPPVKMPNPVLVGDQPWENWAVDPHGSPCVLWDEEEGIYKLWYQAYSVVPPHTERYIMCYATSRDGLTWEKPDLSVTEFRGSRHNNIVLMGHSQWALTNVIKDGHDIDPARRYKSLSWDDDTIAVAFSPDGVRWTLYPGNPVMRGTGDSHNILPYDSSLGKYIGYFRPGREAGHGKRVIGYSTSDDFIHWSPIEVILKPDNLDPLGEEYYQMPVMPYEGDFVGFLWVYHNVPHWPWTHGAFDRADLRGSEQTLEAELTFSHDTRHFIHAGGRAIFLPVGAPGAWDQGMVTVSTVIPHGDELWIYYSGSTAKHFFEDLLNLGKVVNGQRWMVAMGLAKLRRDGFLSLRGGKTEGCLLTRPFAFGSARQLILNADAHDGRIEVELVDDQYHPIAGFTRGEFRPIHADGVALACSWAGGSDLTRLAGRPVRARISLRHADLYALGLRP